MKSIVCLIMVIMFFGCSSYDKKIIKSQLEICIGAEGEELKSCLTEQMNAIASMTIPGYDEFGNIKEDPRIIELLKAIEELEEELDDSL
jgi:hypothetical protein